MTVATVLEKVKSLGHGETSGMDDIKRQFQRKTVSFSPGLLAAKAVFNGCFMVLDKTSTIQACRISDLAGGIAAHGADYITATLGYNDGAAGGTTAIAHWSTLNTAEGALTALHSEAMAATGVHTAFVPLSVAAGKYLTLQLATAGNGQITNLMIEIEYDETS